MFLNTTSNIKTAFWYWLYKTRNKSLLKFRQLLDLQFTDIDTISEKQNILLKKLLLHSYSHTQYYKMVLKDANVINETGQISIHNFHNIPLLTKDILKNNFDHLTSINDDNHLYKINFSGGSTGTPMKFIQDSYFDQWTFANKYLFDHWTGIGIGDRKIYLWGDLNDLLDKKTPLKVRWGRWIKNERWLNSFKMSEKTMHRYVSIINSFKPLQITAYAESVYELAKFIQKSNFPIYSPKAIISSAGTLHPKMRDTIETAFKTSVFNRYGTREMGDIACECHRQQGLHINPFTHYVEIIKSNGESASPGEIGNVVVTLLTNYSMPLIRYPLDDLATVDENFCGCGIQWPLIKNIYGRVTDSFITKNNDIINSLALYPILVDLESTRIQKWVKQFQAIQTDYNEIKILLECTNKNNDRLSEHSDDLEIVTHKIRQIMGQNCNVSFEIVNEIPTTPSGKGRRTISLVNRI